MIDDKWVWWNGSFLIIVCNYQLVTMTMKMTSKTTETPKTTKMTTTINLARRSPNEKLFLLLVFSNSVDRH